MADEPASSDPVVPRAAVSAAIFRGGQILLVKRSKPPAAGLWSLPGGHIEAGEPALEAIKRELREETAISAKISGLAGVKDIVQQNDRGDVLLHLTIIVFYGIWDRGELKAGSDARAVIWRSVSELEKLNLTDGLLDIIFKARRLLLRQIG